MQRPTGRHTALQRASPANQAPRSAAATLRHGPSEGNINLQGNGNGATRLRGPENITQKSP
eukprot:1558880-Pyramimonas_sp.AAC.1